jgi:hypothetical protein
LALLALLPLASGGISACDTFDPSFYIDAGPLIEVGSPADVAVDRAGEASVSDAGASPDAAAPADAAADVADDAPPLSLDALADGSSS